MLNRLFYLSIPPINIFMDIVKSACLKDFSTNGWTRVIIENPFGCDSKLFIELCLKQTLIEDKISRIDHYLDKELVRIILVIHFSILVFEPLWSRNALFVVETHVSLDAKNIRNENVRVLRSKKTM